MKSFLVVLTVFMSLSVFAGTENAILTCESADQSVTIYEGSGYTTAVVKKGSSEQELLCQGDLASGYRCTNGEVVVTAYRASVQFDYIAEIGSRTQLDLAICSPL